MWLQKLLFFSILLAVNTQDDEEEERLYLQEGEKKLSENILAVLEHFKQADPIGLPGAVVPEPYPVDDATQSLALNTIYFKNTVVYGINKFRVLYINAEIGRMEVQAALTIDKLHACGNYTISSWFETTDGTFTVDVTGLKVTAIATLGVDQDGQLKAQDIITDLDVSTFETKFGDLGMFGGVLKDLINNGGKFLFDFIKPDILREADTKARDEINEKLDAFAGDVQFPNSISPLDMVIIDARKKVQDMQLDPYQIKDFNTSIHLITVGLSEIWITGISSFRRVGNITLKMENHTVVADFEIGTLKLTGTTKWGITAIGLWSKDGTASFSVEYVNARIILAQPLDTTKKPIFKGLNLEIGNIQVRCNGIGTLDYVIESAVNILPNMLRYQIMDALETPLKQRVQEELNKLNIDSLIKSNLPQLVKMQNAGIKLSALKSPEVENIVYNDDEFFNF